MSLIDLARLLVAPTADPDAPGRCCACCAAGPDDDGEDDVPSCPEIRRLNTITLPSQVLALAFWAGVYVVIAALSEALHTVSWVIAAIGGRP